MDQKRKSGKRLAPVLGEMVERLVRHNELRCDRTTSKKLDSGLSRTATRGDASDVTHPDPPLWPFS